MTERLRYWLVNPRAVEGMRALQGHVDASGLGHSLLELVKLRASYMNGCAFCVDLHSGDALEAGESVERLFAVGVWREAQCFTPRERAALEWTEAVTRLPEGGVPDAVYAEALRHFDEAELVDLTLAIVAINGWNRLAVAFRIPPGSYRRERIQTGGAA